MAIGALSPSVLPLALFELLDAPDERQAVTKFCEALGLESIVEQSLALIAVRNLRASCKYAAEGAKPEESRYLLPDAVDRVRIASLLSRQAELQALRAIQVLQSAKRPAFVNVNVVSVTGADR